MNSFDWELLSNCSECGNQYYQHWQIQEKLGIVGNKKKTVQMSSLSLSLTKDDFINSCWQDVVAECDSKDCLTYKSEFWKKSEEKKQAGKQEEQAVFDLLTAITDIPINPKSINQLFTERLTNLTKEQLDFLEEIIEEILDAELQARIADILWVLNRNYKMAQLAISAYLQSAKTLEDPNRWGSCFKRIERATRLAFQIRHKIHDVIAHIEDVLAHYKGEDPSLLSVHLMELLQEFKYGEPIKYTKLSEKAATSAELANNWRKARKLWEIKAVWHRQEKNYVKEFDASMKAAETFVKEAEATLKKSSPS